MILFHPIIFGSEILNLTWVEQLIPAVELNPESTERHDNLSIFGGKNVLQHRDMDFSVICWNARGSNGSDVGFQTSIDAINSVHSGRSAASVTEFDFHSSHEVATSFENFHVYRHWGGPGCRSFAWIFRSPPEIMRIERCRRMFGVDVIVHGRRIKLVGIHGSNVDECFLSN